MKATAALVGCVVLAASTSSARAQSHNPQAAHEILAAEDARFNAMVGADTTALRLLLADDLQYVHSTGRLETRPEFLSAVGSRTIRYLSIAPIERRVLLLDTAAAAVAGHAKVHVISGGTDLDLEIRYISVYSRTAGRWQLRAWESVRVAPLAGR